MLLEKLNEINIKALNTAIELSKVKLELGKKYSKVKITGHYISAEELILFTSKEIHNSIADSKYELFTTLNNEYEDVVVVGDELTIEYNKETQNYEIENKIYFK